MAFRMFETDEELKLEKSEYIRQNPFNYMPDEWKHHGKIDDEIENIARYLMKEYRTYYPFDENIFKIFHLLKPDQIRVVIIGQDPYPHRSYKTDMPLATGLAFSINQDESLTSSLVNICKELKRSVPNFGIPVHGDLSSWVTQGVMLLNSALTVVPNVKITEGHANIWSGFICEILKIIHAHNKNVVYMMWGRSAQKFDSIISPTCFRRNKAVHPSGKNGERFIGCDDFVECNKHLIKIRQNPIDWNIF